MQLGIALSHLLGGSASYWSSKAAARFHITWTKRASSSFTSSGSLETCRAQLSNSKKHFVRIARPETGLRCCFFKFGQVNEAEKRAGGYAPVIAFYRGDLQKAKRSFQASPPGRRDVDVCLMARLGMLSDAEQVYRDMVGALGPEADLPQTRSQLLVIEGQLALAKGDANRGISLLEERLPVLENTPGSVPMTAAMLGVEALAREYRRQGRVNDEIRVLEVGAKTLAFAALPFRERGELRLADVYREMGRVPEAERVESALRKQLAVADHDHPILKALAQRATK